MYPTTLLDLFISLDSLFVDSLEFSVFKVMTSANNFAFSFLICMPFIYISCLITLAKPSSTMLNRSGEDRIFQSFAIKQDTIILSTSLFSCTRSCSSSFCTFFVLKLAFTPSSPASSKWKMGSRNQDLGTRCDNYC